MRVQVVNRSVKQPCLNVETLARFADGPKEVAGRGALGVVYKVQGLTGPVAVKMAREDIECKDDPNAFIRNEGDFLAQFNHPNIIRCEAFGTINNRPFIALEWVPDLPISRLFQPGCPLRPETAVSFIYQMALGLHEVHKSGWVHADVKSGNAFYLFNKDRVVLSDFAFARVRGQWLRGLEGPDNFWGTNPFLSPARYNMKPPIEEDDIYALGICLFEMLKGYLPEDQPGYAVHPWKLARDLILMENSREVPKSVVDLTFRLTGASRRSGVSNPNRFRRAQEVVGAVGVMRFDK